MPAAWVAPAVALYTASQSGGGGGGGSPSNYQYIPTGSGAADTSWQQLLAQMKSGTGGLSDVPAYLQQTFQGQQKLPYAGMQEAGNQAGKMYTDMSGVDMRTAEIMRQMGIRANAGGEQVFNTAMDPQNAIYDRSVQRLQEQQRAANTASGVASSPFGAGLEGQTMGNFNLDWEHARLGREMEGLRGLNMGQQQSGADYSAMLQAMGMAPQHMMLGGSTPVSVGRQIGQMQTGAAGEYSSGIGQAMAPFGALQSQIIPYLNSGQGAGGNAFNMFDANRNFGAYQQQMGMRGLVSGADAFSNSNAGKQFQNWWNTPSGGYDQYGANSAASAPGGDYMTNVSY